MATVETGLSPAVLADLRRRREAGESLRPMLAGAGLGKVLLTKAIDIPWPSCCSVGSNR